MMHLESESSLDSFQSTSSSDDEILAPSLSSPLGGLPSGPILPLVGGRSNGAFSSYVRNRGEPDGARASTNEYSKGGGRRESDAGFTPSPIDSSSKYRERFNTNQDHISNSGSPKPAPRIALTLSHQSKIRTKYTPTSPNCDNSTKRHDSSSSTSSMTDWESGQSTVRRQPPPPPPPKLSGITLSPTSAYQMASNTRVSDVSAGLGRSPYVPFNNQSNNSQASSGFDSQSSDSDFGPKRIGTAKNVYTTIGSSSVLKLPKKSNKITAMDRLSVRTEFGQHSSLNSKTRKGIDDLDIEIEFSSPIDRGNVPLYSSTNPAANNTRKSLIKPLKLSSSDDKNHIQFPIKYSSKFENNSISYNNFNSATNNNAEDMSADMNQKSVQDHIIASQISRLNRETPISDVYHDRNVGLGLAPPLSKLLLTTHSLKEDYGVTGDLESKTGSEESFGTFDKLSIADELSPPLTIAPIKPKPPPPPVPPKRFSAGKSWGGSPHTSKFGPISAVNIEENFINNDSNNGINNTRPEFIISGGLELCKRDEGDGRSMTDSNYSGYSPSRSTTVTTTSVTTASTPRLVTTDNTPSSSSNNADISYGVTLLNPPPRALYTPKYSKGSTDTIGNKTLDTDKYHAHNIRPKNS